MKKTIFIISVLALLLTTACTLRSGKVNIGKPFLVKEHLSQMKEIDPNHFQDSAGVASILIADESVYYFNRNFELLLQAVTTPNDRIKDKLITQFNENHIDFNIRWVEEEQKWVFTWDTKLYLPIIR